MTKTELQFQAKSFVMRKRLNRRIKIFLKKKLLGDGTIEYRLRKNSYEGKTAPDFSVKTIDGKTINSADLKGKVIVLNFWFISCAGCIAEMPKLNEFVEKHKSNENIVFIALTFEAENQVSKFLQKKIFDYQIVADARQTLGDFTFQGYPKNIVIGKSGEIVYWRSTIWA